MNVRVIKRIFAALLVGAVVQTVAAQLELTWQTIDGGGKISSTGVGLSCRPPSGKRTLAP